MRRCYDLRRCGPIVGLLYIPQAKVHTDDLAAELFGDKDGALPLTAGHVENANTRAESQTFSQPRGEP